MQPLPVGRFEFTLKLTLINLKFKFFSAYHEMDMFVNNLILQKVLHMNKMDLSGGITKSIELKFHLGKNVMVILLLKGESSMKVM